MATLQGLEGESRRLLQFLVDDKARLMGQVNTEGLADVGDREGRRNLGIT